MATLVRRPAKVTRWFVHGEFNPGSPKQIRALMAAFGETSRPGKHSKSGKPSTDRKVMDRLATRHQVFRDIQDWKDVKKLDSTYATGLTAHADDDDRIHASFTHKPYTMRLACINPNLQNIPQDDEEDSFAKQFRRCIIAQPGCRLVSADFAGIEAVQTGWFSGDRDYYRLARLGVHAYLVSHRLDRPVNLSWSDEDLGAALSEVKAKFHDRPIYKQLKRVVHRTNYGSGPYGMHMDDPHMFPTVQSAEDLQDYYYTLVPKLAKWHSQVRTLANAQGFLGGDDHPYKFKAWFWDVMHYERRRDRMVRGSDWNKVVAYYPQSSSAGNLFDTMLMLMDKEGDCYVGDLFYGKTPIRALIHDEILAEVPENKLDIFYERCAKAMTYPVFSQALPKNWELGEYMQHRAEMKVGQNWADMEAV
ncbi:MAG: hypothetical protein GY906_24760 [bacterium]|nr:hypothetical protein [bacterium]